MTPSFARSLGKLLVAALLALGPGAAQADEAFSVSVAEARQIAVAALSQGQPELAAQIAAGLLQRDPGDAFAHFVLARALQRLQQPKAGRRQAALAYRHATDSLDKYQASQLAATLAVESGSPGLAQLWLRRSWNHAPTEQARNIMLRDYRVLRAINPWSVQARFSITPSDNVNNGAEDPYALIDGVPVVGILSADTLALSGVKSAAELSLGYRVGQSARRQTRVTGRLFLHRVSLSDKARAQAPMAHNSDFAYTEAELGLQHRIAIGEKGGALTLDAAVGQSWYAGDRYQTTYRAGASRVFALGTAAQAMVGGQVEHAVPDGAGAAITGLDLSSRMAQKLLGGGTLSYGLSLELDDSDFINARRQRATSHIGYALAEPIGPARVSFSLGASLGDYPDYRVGPITVPGGRKDRTVFGSADFVFENLDYAGFVPSLKIQAQKTQSNVSRFETNELSISLGIVSRF